MYQQSHLESIAPRSIVFAFVSFVGTHPDRKSDFAARLGGVQPFRLSLSFACGVLFGCAVCCTERESNSGFLELSSGLSESPEGLQ